MENIILGILVYLTTVSVLRFRRNESNIDFLKDQIMTIRRHLEDQRRSNEKTQNAGS